MQLANRVKAVWNFLLLAGKALVSKKISVLVIYTDITEKTAVLQYNANADKDMIAANYMAVLFEIKRAIGDVEGTETRSPMRVH